MMSYKKAYILGDMLYKGSQLLRAQEVEQLRAIGIPLYSAAEQNKDGDINDKQNQTKESNADLHAHIFKKDMDNIYASDLIIANPERFAEGSIAELGAVETFNDIHSTMSDIVYNPRLTPEEKILAIQVWLSENPYKEVYVHLEDIRCTNIEEVGFDRSFYVNQFIRGLAVAAQTGERGVPVSQGGIDIMSWEKIMGTLQQDLDHDYDFIDDYDDNEVYDDTQVEPIEFEAVYDSEHRY